jgi:hypothetical protein
LDTGFNYKKAPNATVPAKFILSNISGTFSSGNTLSSHVGNVTDFNEENKILN